MNLLNDSQRRDLNLSILAYVNSCGWTTEYESLKNAMFRNGTDTNGFVSASIESLDKEIATKNHHLERKWASIIKLSKKVLELEKKLSSIQKSDILTDTNIKEDWIPSEDDKVLFRDSESPVLDTAFHPNGRYFATCSVDGSIRIWDIQKKIPLKILQLHSGAVHCISFNTGKIHDLYSRSSLQCLLASGSEDQSIIIWDASQNYSTRKTLVGHTSAVLTLSFGRADPNTLISGSRDMSVRIWSTLTGVCDRIIKFPDEGWIRTVSVNYRDNIACGGDSKIVSVYSRRGDFSCNFFGHQHFIEQVKWFPHEATERLIETYFPDKSPENHPGFIASCSRDKTIMIWDLSTSTQINCLSGHDGWIRALAFHPSGKYIISCSDDISVKFWDIENNFRCKRTLDKVHKSFINSVTCYCHTKDNSNIDDIKDESIFQKSKHQIMLTASDDGAVYLWHPRMT